LPASIADRLKSSPEIIADSFAEVTVLFADLNANLLVKQQVDE
jgi:hypothetical protein